jgi:hypothetical protein
MNCLNYPVPINRNVELHCRNKYDRHLYDIKMTKNDSPDRRDFYRII